MASFISFVRIFYTAVLILYGLGLLMFTVAAIVAAQFGHEPSTSLLWRSIPYVLFITLLTARIMQSRDSRWLWLGVPTLVVLVGFLLYLVVSLPSVSDKPNSTVVESYHYVMSSPNSDLYLKETRDGWDIQLEGGAIPNGGATAADCVLLADGTLAVNILAAHIIPFQSTNTIITEKDIARNSWFVTVNFEPGKAIVKTNFDGCGIGSDLNGTYLVK